MAQGTQRKLAAIVSADVVGYSRLMGVDEAGTLATMRAHREDLWNPIIERFGGRVVGTAGDAILIEYASAVAAVESSIAVQQGMAERNADLPDDERMLLRIGINVGEVIIEDDDIFGDGVNVAARLEALSEPGGITLSDDAHRQVRDRMDVSWKDGGEYEVKNIARPIQIWRWIAIGPEIADTTDNDSGERTGGEKPSIVVLPFTNMSDDPEQEFFADGLSEDLITALSRFHSFDVVGRNTAFTFKGLSVDLKHVAQELGVHYILEGSVRKAGNRVRITAQLIDGLGNSHIWAERYDRELDDVFEVQDEIIEVIVATLAHKIDSEETERRIRSQATGQDAYDYYLTGREYFFFRNRNMHIKSVALIDKALELDPEFARAHGFRAWLKAYGCRYGWSDNSERCMAEAMSSALKGLSLDPSDYDVHWRLGVVYLHARQFGKALSEYRKAQSLNPNHAGFLAEMAGALVLLGLPEEAITQLEQAKHNNPQYPEWFDANLGWAYYHAGQFERAAETFHALNEPPGVFRVFIAANHAHQGRLVEAMDEVSRLMQSEPDFTLSKLDFLPYKNATDRDMLAEDLRKSGAA